MKPIWKRVTIHNIRLGCFLSTSVYEERYMIKIIFKYVKFTTVALLNFGWHERRIFVLFNFTGIDVEWIDKMIRSFFPLSATNATSPHLVVQNTIIIFSSVLTTNVQTLCYGRHDHFVFQFSLNSLKTMYRPSKRSQPKKQIHR